MPEHAQDPRRPDIGGLRTPPVEEWDSWPFAGGVTPKALRAPEPEPDRDGEGARPCTACGKGDEAYIWTDERWRLQSFPPSGLPAVLILEPRVHVDGPRDLPDDMLAEMGVMLARVERAVLAIEASSASTSSATARAPLTCTGGSWPGRRACARRRAASR